MSIKLMSLVWQDHTGVLTGIEKAVLVRMADFSAENGTQIFPSVQTIAKDTSFSDKSVRRAINSLVEKKYISKTIRTRKAVHISNLYRIIISTLEKAAEASKLKSNLAVNKPVDKRRITPRGGVTQTRGVGSHRPEGGVTETRNPPLIHHIDPPTAKDTTICSKNEQQIEQERLIEITQSKIPDSEKIKAMKDMKNLLKTMRK